MDTSPLIVTRQDAIVTLQFNRPEALNALDLPMAQAMLQAVQGIAQDASVRAVLLKGAGRAFIAGGDLATLHADPVRGARALLAGGASALQIRMKDATPREIMRVAKWLRPLTG